MNSALKVSKTKIPLLISLLLLVYLINCFTPLRLTFDTIRYLNIKEWIEAGRPPGTEAATDFLPHGYVWFLYLLSALHLCISPVICFIQLAFYLSGCWLLSRINGYKQHFTVLLLIGLLNWTVLKFVITPLSEMQFFFLTSMSIYFYHSWEKRKRLSNIFLCAVCAALAVLTRTAGVALVISLILAFLISNRQLLFRHKRWYLWLAFILIIPVSMLIIFADSLHISDYLQFFTGPYKAYSTGIFFSITWLHGIDFASVLLNFPSSKVNFVPAAVINLLFFMAGLFFIILLVFFMLSRKSTSPIYVRIYVAVYLVIIMNWPYYEPRFFLPVLPLIILLVAENFSLLRPLLKKLLMIYIVCYAGTGIAALSYYTYTSVKPKELAKKQDAGIWRNEYETYFFGKPASDTATVVQQQVVDLLKKYN
jgi:hypothetical protein